jgi:Zn-dependent peptidase ImmA (M78 family)
MTRVKIKPELFVWARERSRLSADHLAARFPSLERWQSGDLDPTLKQAEDFAKTTHVPVGYLFLPAPPDEPLPIPDFRTMAGREVRRPSPNLLEVIYACQQRQDWFREHARLSGQGALAFVGSATVQSNIEQTAAVIRRALGFDLDVRARCPTWTDALRAMVSQADAIGVLVMTSGIVASNTHRRLDTEEFRGFALVDPLAPLVFVNGSDSKSAQMFTLAHELAHVWLGQTALSDTTVASHQQNSSETWCNRVAAEVLAPLDVLRGELRAGEPLANTVQRLARRFKVSSLVVLQRLRDSQHLSGQAFDRAYREEIERLANLPKRDGGGDFYVNTTARYSRRFTRALVESTLEGRTLYRDALRMLGISKTETLHELGRNLAFSG